MGWFGGSGAYIGPSFEGVVGLIRDIWEPIRLAKMNSGV